MSQTLEAPKQIRKGETTRIIGTIIREPVQKTSKAGNLFWSLSVAANPTGKKEDSVYWNMTVMNDLYEKIVSMGAGDLFSKFRYAKFVGLASKNNWTDKTGAARIGNDMLVGSIELQNGSVVTTYEGNNNGRSKDEDAPF